MGIEQPFHPGEIAVQERAGERASAIRNGRAIANTIIPGARKFIASQPMSIVGSVGRTGTLWASVLFGEPGFASAGEQIVSFDRKRMIGHAADPLWSNLRVDAPVGILFIELASRRRFRTNGTVLALDANTLAVRVREAYPNCPKYIQRRNLRLAKSAPGPSAIRTHEGTQVTSAVGAILESADTLFVASAHAERGVDASHRGGPPGFVKVLDDQTLRVPDYAGNGMFNTLGNLSLNPNAGLVFIDFRRHDVLQLTGRAALRFGLEDRAGETGGTARFWDFRVDRWLLSEGAAPAHWEFLEYSPVLPSTAR